MSDGKASSYRVVSAEELRRRAVAAARERLDRANQAALELGVLVSAAETTYGALDVVAPVGSPSASDDPAVIDRLAHQVEKEVAATRGRAQDAIAKARSRHLEEAAGELLASLRPTEPLAELKRAAPASARAVGSQMEDAMRIVRRLPGDALPESVQRCEQLVADVASVGSEAKGAVLLTALRAEVQSARDRSETVSMNRDELARLYRQLDGLEGDEVSEVRGYLRGLPLDAPLPAGLVARVENVREEALRELGDKVPSAERGSIETQINDLKQAAQGDDVANIKKQTETLQNTFHALSQQLYSQGQPQEQGQPSGGPAASGPKDGDVIDGEVKE